MTERPAHTGAARVIRGGLLGFSSTALAGTAHAAAGGGIPDIGVTLVLALLLGWVGTALADRTSGVLPLLCVLGISQLSLHLLLENLIHQHSAGAPAVPADGMAMTGAHAVATVLTACVLARAETALLAIAATFRLTVPTLWRAPAVARPATAPVLARPERASSPFELLLHRVCPRRGPPAHS